MTPYYINNSQKLNEILETMKILPINRGDQHRYEYGFIGCNLPLNINGDQNLEIFVQNSNKQLREDHMLEKTDNTSDPQTYIPKEL